ncbi:hypothetical protein PI125_g22292 [Phytophthora idaei]|nr:hypothetical protein PI125_g22292 [Phytophthora idaei]KAG3126730.1 hypothetical protein PI126_g22200 [Phytophthora idaei]
MVKYVPGLSSTRYFQLIHGEGSRYTWCYIPTSKSEVADNTQWLIAQLLVAGKVISKFTSDGGGEYVNKELKGFQEKNGIVLTPTHPYTP